MWNPFFYEFRVVPSVNVFRLICGTDTITGFIRGILRGIRYAKSLRVLFLHRRSPSWTTLVLYSRVVFIFNEPTIYILYHRRHRLDGWPWSAPCSAQQKEMCGGHDLFCNGTLQGQAAPANGAWADELQATVKFSCWFTVHAVFYSSPLKLCMACSISTPEYPCRLLVFTCLQSKIIVQTIGGFVKGILRGVRCTKSLRVLFTSMAPLQDHSCSVLKSSIHL
jgi:hypothetical protein